MSLDESETPTESLCPRIHVDSLEMMCKDNKIRTNEKHIPLNKDIKTQKLYYIYLMTNFQEDTSLHQVQ